MVALLSVLAGVRQCVRPETRYLAEYLTYFHQTYTNDVLWVQCIKFWGQKVAQFKVT